MCPTELLDIEHDNFRTLLQLAHDEDLADGGDITGLLLDESLCAHTVFTARETMVVCGMSLLEDIAAAYSSSITTTLHCADGDACATGDVLAEWSGPARDIVAAERVALNFLQRLSGIATLTRRYVAEVAHTSAKILDTRKTTPAWRDIEKYAVRVGGGTNHRRGLYDAILIKDNHIATIAGAGTGEPIERLREPILRVKDLLPPEGFVQIEVDTLDQFAIALTLPVDIIMLDNMPPAMMAEAVAIRNEIAPKIELEASGGITLDTLAAAAESGVDRISIGALTHSAQAVDIGLDGSFLPTS